MKVENARERNRLRRLEEITFLEVTTSEHGDCGNWISGDRFKIDFLLLVTIGVMNQVPVSILSPVITPSMQATNTKAQNPPLPSWALTYYTAVILLRDQLAIP